MNAPKLLLITPYFAPAVQGNAITTGRLVRGLHARGVEVRVVSLDRQTPDDAAAAAPEFGPELVHGFHAFRSAAAVRAVRAARSVPFVLTVTGTDLNLDLDDPARRATVLSMLREAARIVAFHESMRERIGQVAADLVERVVLIPQSVQLPASARDFRAEQQVGSDDIVFLLPAGLRPVKNNSFAIPLLATLRAEGAPVRLWLAGPRLDEAFASAVLSSEGAHVASYLGAVPHEDMSALYRAADVVLNTSLSEGGMCNAVLEAMSLGKPVLAADIPGNRSVIRPQENGLLYRGGEAADFLDRARSLLANPELRQQLGAAAAATIARDFSFDREIEAHVRLYEGVMS